VQELRVLAGSEQLLDIRSNRALRETSLEIFDRTFAITGVLQLLATIVAFVGILAALMALQLERARELGVLRANGLTPGQLWGLVLGQTGLMGLAAGALAAPVGVMMAAVLVYVINKRSFGWTLLFNLDGTLFAQAMLVAVTAALLAGLYPAWRMGRTPPALALREE
jgi:putative ABC transport system permease protein